MSVSVHVSITVRGYNPIHLTAIKQAVREVVEYEQIEDYLPPLEEDGEALVSKSDPDNPLNVSRAGKWEQKVNQALSEAVEKANGGPCEVLFEVEDAEDVPDYADED